MMLSAASKLFASGCHAREICGAEETDEPICILLPSREQGSATNHFVKNQVPNLDLRRFMTTNSVYIYI
jgi:hypothetical protein